MYNRPIITPGFADFRSGLWQYIRDGMTAADDLYPRDVYRVDGYTAHAHCSYVQREFLQLIVIVMNNGGLN